MRSLFRIWNRLGLSGQILIGLGLGILLGLFVGEDAAQLDPVAHIYIKLMQMTVLPYLLTALIVGFGQLDMSQAKRLALRGGLLLLLVWGVMIALIFLMPMAFPEFISASFYSSALVEPPKPFSLAEIYFTSNPFESLSSNVVPAVVLFSCLMGVALIGLDRKERLLDPLRVWNEAIVGITHFVIRLTPIGVFAIGAVTAGTMTPETLVRLEAYFVAFAALSVLLGFVILPLLVTAVTPFSYREVVGIARDALLTAFVAHNAFIVLPILVERSKELFKRHGLLNDKTNSAAEVIIPVLFNFPNAGKLLTLLFVPFVAWLAGAPMPTGEYGAYFAAGIPSYFAKAQVAIPFLLDLFGLPHDLFLLYIPTTIITGKFDSMVTAMNLLMFAMLGAGAMGGFLVWEKRRLIKTGLIIAVATAVTVLGVKWILAVSIDTSYHLDENVRQMQLPEEVTEIAVYEDAQPPPDGAHGLNVFTRVMARGTLRIGFASNNLPFSYFNAEGKLVGFDVEIAARLARELGLRPEFVPIEWERVPELLSDGVIDVMPGMWYRPNWFGRVELTAPYLEGTVGFATLDERRHEFARIEDLRRSQGLRIGIPLDRRQVEHSIEHYFDSTDVEYVVIPHWKPYFEGKHPDVDAFLMPAEHASGWSLLHPEYTVVVPQPDPIRISTAFGAAIGAHDLVEAINEWVIFARNTGEIDQAYQFWVLGQGAVDESPRWSIMRDVLGWGVEP